MSFMRYSLGFSGLCLMMGSAVSAAQVDLSSYVNANASTFTSGSNYPTGSTTIGGINFLLAPYGTSPGPGVLLTNANVSTFDITGLNIASPATAYTIINSGFGQFGATVGYITFLGSGGASATYNLVEGTNIRDHYYGSFNNIATDLFATTGYSGGSEIPNTPGYVRFDVQQFSLSGLLGQNLVGIDFVGNNPNGGEPFLAAVTTAAAAAGGVPEPASWAMMIGGLGLAGAALRRRRMPAIA